MSRWIAALRSEKPERALTLALPNPGASLRGKFSVFVLLATLVTALTVTLVSIQSIRAFLYDRIELKLPSLLESTSQKLDLSYRQRLHELSVFAASDSLVEGMENYSDAGSEADKRDIRMFLGYVFENSPQFESLFVLDAGGELITWAGKGVALKPTQRTALSDVGQSSLTNLSTSGQGSIQIVSAPISEYRGKVLGTLHAAIDLDSMREHLQSEELSEAGAVYLLDREGRYIAVSTRDGVSADTAGTYRHTVPRSDSKPLLSEYENGDGERVLGSSIYLPRIDGALVMEEPYAAAFAPVSSILMRTLAINLAIVLLFSYIAYRIAVSITRPIDELSKGVRRIGEGEREVVIPTTSSNDELGALTQAFNTMASQLDHNTRELERLSSIDELTQVYNYRFFKEKLTNELDKHDGGERSLALMLCDIDHFKQWNDRFGHASGDEILSWVAGLLKNACRDTDVVARYGGDEFAVLAPNTSLEGALALAEKLRTLVIDSGFPLEGEQDIGNATEALTISTGVAVYSESAEQLFEEADRALYSAKQAGRDCVRAAGVKG